QVWALGHRLSDSPFEGRYRVVVVDPADARNVYAADAFLKTLEEPPPATVLILATAREEALLETVRSRLRRVDVRPAPADVLAEELQRRGCELERAAVLARLSRGCAGWAIAAASDAGLLEQREQLLDE